MEPCERNCSFVSGEASDAGWLICVLFVLPPRYRMWTAPPVILASLATAGLRVAVGAHYASDATLGLLLSIAVFLGLLALEERIAER
ncbi:phosphatase PAP2 family protein [Rhizobium sp. 21-4511-3d]